MKSDSPCGCEARFVDGAGDGAKAGEAAGTAAFEPFRPFSWGCTRGVNHEGATGGQPPLRV